MEPPRGRLLRLARLGLGPDERRAARRGRAGRRHVRPGHGLLRRRQRRRTVDASRLQLRLAGGDRRRRGPARAATERRGGAGDGALAARRGSRRAGRSRSKQQQPDSETVAVQKTKCTCTCCGSPARTDRIGDQRRQQDQPTYSRGCQFSSISPVSTCGRRSLTAWMLRRRVRGYRRERPRDEPRLHRRLEPAGRDHPERRADRLAGKGAEAGAAEVAIAAGRCDAFAHSSRCSNIRTGLPRSDHRGENRTGKRCRGRKLTNFRDFRRAEIPAG